MRVEKERDKKKVEEKDNKRAQKWREEGDAVTRERRDGN